MLRARIHVNGESVIPDALQRVTLPRGSGIARRVDRSRSCSLLFPARSLNEIGEFRRQQRQFADAHAGADIEFGGEFLIAFSRC